MEKVYVKYILSELLNLRISVPFLNQKKENLKELCPSDFQGFWSKLH